MRIKTRILGLITALMVLSIPMVYADNGTAVGKSCQKSDDWHHGQKDHMQAMAKILGLTDDQVKQLKDLHKAQEDTMKSTFGQLKSNREAFDVEIVKATPDMTKITDLQNQLKTIQAQMVDSQLSSILAIKKIMTPEQYAGYAALKKEKRMKKHMMGHDKFGHKDGWGKDGDGHGHWADKGDQDQD